MSLPPGNYTDVPDYLCRCTRCGPDGKVLARTTWYNHNPGGKKAKLPEPSQEQITVMLNQPAPRFSQRRKRPLEEAEVVGRAHISKRAIGSSSVCAL